MWEQSQSNHSCSQLEAFLLLYFLCEKNLKLHLRIPAVKCRSYSSKLLLAKRRGLIIWWWLTMRPVIAVWPRFRRLFTTVVILLTASCIVLFILTHSQCGELAPAISQMFVQDWPLWLETKPNFKVLFCALNLLLWKLLLWIHTCVFLATCLPDHYWTVAGNMRHWLKCWFRSWLRCWQYCRTDRNWFQTTTSGKCWYHN